MNQIYLEEIVTFFLESCDLIAFTKVGIAELA